MPALVNILHITDVSQEVVIDKREYPNVTKIKITINTDGRDSSYSYLRIYNIKPENRINLEVKYCGDDSEYIIKHFISGCTEMGQWI